MRVALLSYEFGEYCVRLANALSSEAEVLLLLPENLPAPRAALRPAVTFRSFVKPRLRHPLRQIRTTAGLLRHIRAFGADVVHLQQGHLWFNLALPLLSLPLVVTIHDPRHHAGDEASRRTPQQVYDFGFRRAAQTIVQGESLRGVVERELHLEPARVHVVPHIVLGDVLGESDDVSNEVSGEVSGAAHPKNGLESGKLHISESNVSEPQIAGLDGNAPLILFFGRIWPYKGLAHLIRAEPLITAEVPEAKIVIAGEGEDFAPYRRMMVHPDRFVVFNRYVSDAERAALFRRSSVVVLPYTDASQSGVIPVAYTFEKPVVATTVGALPDMVEHGRTGYLVPPRDEQALADATVRLLRDESLRRRFGRNGKEKVDRECSPAAVARQTLAVYRRAVGGVDGVGPETKEGSVERLEEKAEGKTEEKTEKTKRRTP